MHSAAAWLARCGVRCKVLEKSSGPMERGQADGVQCRTVEIFESFNLSEEMLREAFHILEVAFWQQDEQGKLVRMRRTADTAPGLTHMPHVILNQAIVNGLLLRAMKDFNGQEVDYGYSVKGVEVEQDEIADENAYPVKVIAERDGQAETFRAKYVLVSATASNVALRMLTFHAGLRWSPQPSTEVTWLQNGGRFDRPHMGRHGHLPTNKLPRYTAEVNIAHRRRRSSNHPSRRWLSLPFLYRATAWHGSQGRHFGGPADSVAEDLQRVYHGIRGRLLVVRVLHRPKACGSLLKG